MSLLNKIAENENTLLLTLAILSLVVIGSIAYNAFWCMNYLVDICRIFSCCLGVLLVLYYVLFTYLPIIPLMFLIMLLILICIVFFIYMFIRLLPFYL